MKSVDIVVPAVIAVLYVPVLLVALGGIAVKTAGVVLYQQVSELVLKR